MIRRLIILSIAMVEIIWAGELSPVKILQKVDSVANAPKTKQAKFEMILIDSKGKKNVREGISYETKNKRVIKFTKPASVRNIGFLSLPGDLMYVYLPSFHKIRRIGTSAKNTKFAGTDFTYDELSTYEYSKDYKPELVKEDANTWTLKLVPKTKKDYKYLIMVIDKKTFIPKKIEFYDKAGQLWKVLTSENVKKFKNYNIPTKLTMKDLKENHTTIMLIKDLKVDEPIKKEVFTKRFLKRR